MSDDYDWEDPFADDEEAAERSRRRAEREARRHGQQSSLGEKVRAEQAGTPADVPLLEPETGTHAAALPDSPGNEGASERPATGESAAVDTQGAPAASAPPTREQAVAASARQHTGSHGAVAPGALWARRLLGIVVLLSAIAVVVVVARAIGDLVGGKDEPAAPVAELEFRELTIPEGLDRRQVADLTKEEELKGDYLEATKAKVNYRGFDLGKYGAGDADSLEGFLFPALYELPKKATVRDLISRQLTALEDNLAGVDMKFAKSKNLNVYDVLKIASMVEREIQAPEERDLAAAVIYNRLKAGTPLGIDATIRYEDQNYTEQLTESRLAEPTPYNTRINTGLPPTPIGNPGLASIKAAAHPAKSDAFYFVVKPGTCGEHVFVETEEEFLAAEAEYQAALQEQGGSPTEC